VDAYELADQAAGLRELLSKWDTMPADEMRATIAEAASALDDAAEAQATWPEWAQKLLRTLESFGAEYEYDDEINLPDELSEWLHHYASDIKREAERRKAPA